MHRWTLLFALGCGALALSPRASATTMVAVTVTEQALDSTAVVYARVGPSDPSLGPNGPHLDTRLHVREVLAGQAPPLFNVRQVGGPIGDAWVHVPGDAELVEGDDIVAFVRYVDGRWYLTAMGQSVWTVLGRGPDAPVRRDLDGAHLVELDPQGGVRPTTSSPSAFGTLGQLMDAVRPLQMGVPGP